MDKILHANQDRDIKDLKREEKRLDEETSFGYRGEVDDGSFNFGPA